MNKAIFVDKDGTLIRNVPYNINPENISLLPGIGKSLQLLSKAGYLIIIISNQSGIARGYFTMKDLLPAEEMINKLLLQFNTSIDAFYYCPHHPEGKIPKFAVSCTCRKPASGMLLNASNDYRIALTKSWMVGDILNDIEAGNRTGCRTILIDNGNETEWHLNKLRRPDLITTNFLDAAKYILQIEGITGITSRENNSRGTHGTFDTRGTL